MRAGFQHRRSPTKLLLSLCAAALPLAGISQSPDSFNPAANNTVNAISIQADSKILIGGSFSNMAGQVRNFIARVNSDGSLDTAYNPGANATVNCLALQPDGKALVGGSFSTLAFYGRNAIARLLANGALDFPFSPAVAGSYPNAPSIFAIAIQPDGKIVLGGFFISLAGQSRTNIGRLNADGTIDATFNSGTGSVFQDVFSLALQPDGKTVVGGSFTALSGQACTNIARLNTNGTFDTNFSSSASGTVLAITVQPDGKILTAGAFTNLAGQPCKYIGRLNTNGSLDQAFTASASSNVYSIAPQADGRILVAGYFTNLSGQACKYVGRLNSDGSYDNSFNISADTNVVCLALQSDGKILAGGSFTNFGGEVRNRIARTTNIGTADQTFASDLTSLTWLRSGSSAEVSRTTFESSTNGTVWSSLGSGTRISGGWQLTGLSLTGNLTIRARGFEACGKNNGSETILETAIGPPTITAQPTSRKNDALTTATFTVTVAGNPPLSYHWRKNAIPLGNSSTISGADAALCTLSNVLGSDAGTYSVVITNSFGSITSSFATLTVMDPVISMQPVSATLNPGGNTNFTAAAVGTQPVSYQWCKNGTNLPAATATSLPLLAVQIADAGSYTVIASNSFGFSTSDVAVLTVNLATVDSLNPSLGYGYANSCAALADGKILLTGNGLWMQGGQANTSIVRLNSDGTLDTSFSATAAGSYNEMNAFGVQEDGEILLGGSFTTLGGQARTNIGRLSGSAQLDTGFLASAYGSLNSGPVTALALQADQKIIVGGYFDFLNGQASDGIGRLQTNGLLDPAFTPAVSAYPVALQPDGKLLVAATRLNANGSLDASFNPNVSGPVYCLAIQPDGKILMGGGFGMVGGQYRSYIARVNSNGSLDTTFNPSANSDVYSIALQADGKILLAGNFYVLAGQRRSYLGRLNSDGSLDTSFDPQASAYSLNSVTLQSDGKILVAGYLLALCGQDRYEVGRLNNTAPATQSLSFDGANVTWLRGGTSPEVLRTTFDSSTDGTTWTRAGTGTRISNGWTLANLILATNATIRARGFIAGGQYNGSCWFAESSVGVNPLTPPRILAPRAGTNGFEADVGGLTGQVVIMEASTNLQNWFPVLTNSIGNAPTHYLDPDSAGAPLRFYRARLK